MLSGIVITGKQLGRTIGFPTANIVLDPGHIEDGTYGLIVEIGGKQHFGIGVYLERFSTFESHILDFEGDIYGQEIRINPVVKIRDNEKFSGLEALKTQIQKDKEWMEQWIQTTKEKGESLL